MQRWFHTSDRKLFPSFIFAFFTAGVLFGLFFTTVSRSQSQYSREPDAIALRQSDTPPASTLIPSEIQFVQSALKKAAMPQGLQPVYKTAGTDFFVGFPSCVGSDIPTDPPYKRLYISARSKTRGTVSLVGGGWQKSFVTDPNNLTVIDLPSWAGLDREQTELIYKKLFEVQTEDEVAVYALSSRHLSTDGFLVLPVEALGQLYSVASNRNALRYIGGRVPAANVARRDTLPRSQVLIAGVNDRTTVTLTLSTNSYAYRFAQNQTYSFILNKGEVIEICARDTGKTGVIGGTLYWVDRLANIDCDLTGSIISSDQPIAVFSGHERSSTPDTLEFSYPNHPNVSRDHIIEQMPPAENWGKIFAFIPSSRASTRSRPLNGDAVRIIAGYDLTDISLNGGAPFRLSRGTFKQLMLNRATLITSTQPVLIVKYLQTASSIDTLGDPDMTVLPPIENMSTFYSLPTLTGNGSFSEHYIVVVCDSAAIDQTTLNGLKIDPILFSPLIGSRYYHATIRVAPGTQRIESTLPCYAECYGFGNFNSYSFSGGGSFPYLHALHTHDLDFGTQKVASVNDSLSDVYAVGVPQQLADNSVVYHYTWESGDTTVFGVIDTIRQPATVISTDPLLVHFRFTPPADGNYSAKLRVWSNNSTDLFINVYGKAYSPKIAISVDTLDFGRVRVGNKKDSFFTISNIGDGPLRLDSSNLGNLLPVGSPFSIKRLTLLFNRIDVATSVNDSTSFTPPQRLYYKNSIPVTSDAPTTPIVVLLGRGVDYIIPPVDTSFGKIRVGKKSAWYNIPVTNYGDDSTSITSIRLSGGNISDFEIDATSLPSPINKWLIDTLKDGLGGERKFFRARFTPLLDTLNNIIDTGFKSALVEITTTDNRVIVDTLSGVAGEPILIATPLRIDFGTYTNPAFNSDIRLDTLINIGTFNGIIDSLRHTNPQFFSILDNIQTNPFPENVAAPERMLVPFSVQFHITQVGDYYDTIFAFNDSRFRPLVIVQGKVRAGIEKLPPLDLGSISDCLPLDTIFSIHNPSRVKITISNIYVAGDTAGFSFPDFADSNFPKFPVYIDADSLFTLRLRYLFPTDSLNGYQQAKVIIVRPTDGELLNVQYDTILVTIIRNTKQLLLEALHPVFNPSAGDAPFKVPVHLKGNRFGITELDNDTVKIQFSNDLIKPIGLDRTASLTEEGIGKAPIQPKYVWDKDTRVLTVPMKDVAISSGTSQNVLLFSILCTTFLTPDTVVDINTSVSYVSAPCAFRVAQNSTSINYANECGNITLRDVLLNGKPGISISDPHPNPSQKGNVIIDYISASNYLLSWQIFDERGTQVLSHDPYPITSGQGSVVVPSSEIPASGSYYITITVADAASVAQKRVTTKFSLIK